MRGLHEEATHDLGISFYVHHLQIDLFSSWGRGLEQHRAALRRAEEVLEQDTVPVRPLLVLAREHQARVQHLVKIAERVEQLRVRARSVLLSERGQHAAAGVLADAPGDHYRRR